MYEKKHMRTAEAAAYCRCAAATLEKKRVAGTGPKYIKLGRLVVYDKNDLDTWIASCRRSSTSEGG